jgi:OmpA-OmpF porin, OOP family
MKQAMIVAAVLGTFASQVQAQSQARFYATTAMGSSHMSNDCSFTRSECNTHGLGFKVVGGYEFGNGFSVEAGYLSFGKFVLTVDEIGYSLGDEPTAVTLGGAYTLPLGQSWGANFRLGVARVKTTQTWGYHPFYLSNSQTATKAYGGVGVTYAISSTVKLELGVDSTRSELPSVKRAVSMVSLGATVSF